MELAIWSLDQIHLDIVGFSSINFWRLHSLCQTWIWIWSLDSHQEIIKTALSSFPV